MNKFKKTILSILITSILLMAFPIIAFAAAGSVWVEDVTGAVAADFPVVVTVASEEGPIGEIKLELDFTSSVMDFLSGDGATLSTSDIPGRVVISGSGDGEQTTLTFTLLFRGLEEGSSAIAVRNLGESVATTYDGTDLTLVGPDGQDLSTDTVLGTVTVGPEGSMPAVSDTPVSNNEAFLVEMAGITYAIYEDFTDAMIPSGFSRTTVNLGGVERNAILQDSSGTIMCFLVVGGNDPVLGLFDQLDQTFSQVERVTLSNALDLFVLAINDGRVLPDNLQPTTIDLNGTIFPAWANMDDPSFFVVYALSGNGIEGYYQYDSLDMTFQRKNIASIEQPTVDGSTGLIASLREFVSSHFVITLAAVATLLLLLLIIVIILSIKLGKRNHELEESYDGNYDDDDDYEMTYTDNFDDDYDDEYDDEYDDYETPYDDYDSDYDDITSAEITYDDEEDDQTAYAEDPYDDDIFVDDEDDEEYSSYDDEEIDFIDL